MPHARIPRSWALLVASLAAIPLAGCKRPPGSVTVSAMHPASWMQPQDARFHGAAVKDAGFDYTKAKFLGVTCNTCHAGQSPTQTSPLKSAPNCFSCHGGGPNGTAGHPAWWADPTHPGYHGASVVAAGYDFSKALAPGNTLTCAECHGGLAPNQLGANSLAPNCFVCHGGGPDGSAGHPLGWAVPTGPLYHGAVVIAAGYDFNRAVTPGSTLTCSACHGGLAPTQPSLNLRAPNCFACHSGGPDGSAGHPPGWTAIPDWGELANPRPTVSLPFAVGFRILPPQQVLDGDAIRLQIAAVMSDGSTVSLPSTAKIDWFGPPVLVASDSAVPDAATILATSSPPTGFFVSNPGRSDHAADLTNVLFIQGNVALPGSVSLSAKVSGLGIPTAIASTISIPIAAMPTGNLFNGAGQYQFNCASCHGTAGQGCTFTSIYDDSPATQSVSAPGLNNTLPGGSPNPAADPGWSPSLLAYASRADADNLGVKLNLPMPDWLSIKSASLQFLTTQDYADMWAWLLTQTSSSGSCPTP